MTEPLPTTGRPHSLCLSCFSETTHGTVWPKAAVVLPPLLQAHWGYRRGCALGAQTAGSIPESDINRNKPGSPI